MFWCCFEFYVYPTIPYYSRCLSLCLLLNNKWIDGRHKSPYVVAYTFHFVAETNSPFSPLDSCCFNTSHTYVCCVYPENNMEPAPQVQFCSSSLTPKDIAPFFKMNNVSPYLPLFLWFQTFIETSNVLFHSVSLDFPQNKTSAPSVRQSSTLLLGFGHARQAARQVVWKGRGQQVVALFKGLLSP